MFGLSAGAASLRMAVVADPPCATKPTSAEGLPKPEKPPGRSAGVIEAHAGAVPFACVRNLLTAEALTASAWIAPAPPPYRIPLFASVAAPVPPRGTDS